MMPTNTCFSEKFLSGIKNFEGLELKPYICPTGHLTVGIGHLCGENQKEITEEEAYKLLIEDLDKAVKYLYKYSPVLKDEPWHRTEALASWVFNLGISNYLSSTLRKKVNNKEWEEAAKQILRWKYGRVKGKKVILKGLVRRRQWEYNIFLNNDYSM